MAKTKTKPWTASCVYELIAKLFPAPSYAMLREVRNGTGFARRKDRTADAVAISCWPSRGLYLAGIEIKVSRTDWCKELASPTKADAIQRFCKYWYLAVPKGLVSEGEVPETWGLIECDRSARITKAAPELEPQPPDMLLLCSILRNAASAMVPAEDVQKRIDAALQEHFNAEKKAENYELRQLQETVQKFEEASGVTIGNTWDQGEIGNSVKLVREIGCEHAFRRTDLIRDQHISIAKQLTRLLDGCRLRKGDDDGDRLKK